MTDSRPHPGPLPEGEGTAPRPARGAGEDRSPLPLGEAARRAGEGAPAAAARPAGRVVAAPRAALKEAPPWDLVLKRNFVERLKREKFPLDVRDELPRLIEEGYERISEDDVVRLQWWGLYHDKPKVGTFMMRVKIAGGVLAPAQLRAIGEIANRYGKGYG